MLFQLLKVIESEKIFAPGSQVKTGYEHPPTTQAVFLDVQGSINRFRYNRRFLQSIHYCTVYAENKEWFDS